MVKMSGGLDDSSKTITSVLRQNAVGLVLIIVALIYILMPAINRNQKIGWVLVPVFSLFLTIDGWRGIVRDRAILKKRSQTIRERTHYNLSITELISGIIGLAALLFVVCSQRCRARA